MDSGIRQLIKKLMRSSKNVDWRIRRPVHLAIISLGCLAAAFLSGWSYYSLVFVLAALGFSVFGVYIWTHPRRMKECRATTTPLEARSQKATGPCPYSPNCLEEAFSETRSILVTRVALRRPAE